MEDRICYNCGNLVPERNVSQFYMDCPHCKAITQLYEPQEHQIIFHKDPSPVKALLGGFGSGKSLVADAEIFDHLLRLPRCELSCTGSYNKAD